MFGSFFVDSRWIREIIVDIENSEISYSIPDCTTFTGDPLVVLNITNTNGDVVYNNEQHYDTESTSFNIPSSLSPSLSYNYSLVVIHSDRTVASYTGPVWTSITPSKTTTGFMTPSMITPSGI